MPQGHSIIVIDPGDEPRELLIERLRFQGYHASGFASPIEGAHAALSSPPSAVVANLWMSQISGVQLSRLLGAEPATERVPVVLRGPDDRRNRFWAERAGAAAYVVSGHMSELLQALSRLLTDVPVDEPFFFQLQNSESVIRDRIAAHLDAALFESVLSAEVRALSICGSFNRLFDLLAQFVSQVMSYRWLGLCVDRPLHIGLHCHPSLRVESEHEAREALGVRDEPILRIDDEDALADAQGMAPLIRPIHFGEQVIARLAIGLIRIDGEQDLRIVDVIARELGGPLRMAALVEETQRAATTDPLTGLMNRRAFLSALELERQRTRRHGYPLWLLMLDVDHFKRINDRHGHSAGDDVLAHLARLLSTQLRQVDLVGRWGGEEFVVALSGADEAGARVASERLRQAVAAMKVTDQLGNPLRTTVSIGGSCLLKDDTPERLISRADKLMYQAKAEGRNRVELAYNIPTNRQSDV
jgi:two-component system cell cycle response regulator